MPRRTLRCVGTYHFSPEDGGSIILQNVGLSLQVHTSLLTARPTSKSSQPREPHNSYTHDHQSDEIEMGRTCSTNDGYEKFPTFSEMVMYIYIENLTPAESCRCSDVECVHKLLYFYHEHLQRFLNSCS